MDSLLEKDKKEFKSKTRMNKLMIGEIDVVVGETKEILEVVLSNNKINIAEMNTERVPENEEVNMEVNVNEEENVNEENMNVSDPQEFEVILISPNVENTETPIETKVPKVVLVEEKVVKNEKVEALKVNPKIIFEEPKAEKEKN